MSVDYLNVGAAGRTNVRAPGTELNSALTSLTAGVTLAQGAFDVNVAGLHYNLPYPTDATTSVSLAADSATISVVSSLMLLSPTATRASMVLAPPYTRKTGVRVTLVNRSSFNIAFATSGTSYIGDNATPVLRSFSQQEYVWVEPEQRWFSNNSAK